MNEEKIYFGFVFHLSQETLDKIIEKCKEIGKTLDEVYDEFSYHFEMQRFLLPNDYKTYLDTAVWSFLETGKVK